MDNMQIYNKVRAVPQTALKEIQAGRLKGKSDINPMWRMKTLTEQFGVCGFGWKYEILLQWLEEGGNGEQAAFVNINLYIKIDNEWSEAIPGTGGSMFVAKESKGPYTSDECFKMALTDAISVACKALGVGADVYWSADKTKYDRQEQPKQGVEPSKTQTPSTYTKISEPQAKRLFAISKGNETLVKKVITKYNYTSTKDISTHDYDLIAKEIEAEANQAS
jgi:hypothetical protein